VSEIDYDRLVSRTRRAGPLKSVERLCSGSAELREPQMPVDLHCRLVDSIFIDRVSRT